MASTLAKKSFADQKPSNVDQSLFTLTDRQIWNQIYETHVSVHDDEKLNIESLFIVVENILKRATQILENFVKGTPVQKLKEKIPKVSFRLPLCKLKKISSEMQCKDPGEQIAKETALSILKTLSGYSWEEKAVLTLAAFALDYGEFWIISQQNEPSDQFLATSVGILRGVPLLKSPSQKKRDALIELNNIIKTTLEVIQRRFELEKLPNYDAETESEEIYQVDAFWAIFSVVASTIQFCCLVNDKDKTQELAPLLARKLSLIVANLSTQILNRRQIIEDIKAYSKVVDLFRLPKEIMEAIKGLMDNQQDLLSGFAKETVNIEVLRRKNILLLISGLDISDDDISILKDIHDHDSFKKDDQHKIVWIPIVDQWTDEVQKKFDEIVRKKMPWYVVQNFSSKAGTRFIKEKWHYKNNPIIVVLNPKGEVECEDAFHMIKLWRMEAFPFTREDEETLSSKTDWIRYIVADLDPKIGLWIKEEKYIFFYGGKDNEWVQQFNDRVTKLANDQVIKEANISIESFCVGKGSKGEEQHGILERFWNRIDSLFITKTQSKTETDGVALEIQKLLSLKNESGWVLLSKGSTIVFSGYGTIVIKSLQKIDVRKNGFESTIKEEYKKELRTSHICYHIDIPSTGKIPENMKCPDCQRIMETYIRFKCCHIDGVANGHH